MATITKLEIIPLIYRLPEGRAYGMARGLTSIRQASLVKLTTDDGIEGIGAASQHACSESLLCAPSRRRRALAVAVRHATMSGCAGGVAPAL